MRNQACSPFTTVLPLVTCRLQVPIPGFKLPRCFNSMKDSRFPLLMPAEIGQWPTYPSARFHFAHLHLAMRRFYFGPSFGNSAESLAYTDITMAPLQYQELSMESLHEPKSKKASRAFHQMRLVSFEARVCPNPPSLCLRVQNLVTKRATALLPGRGH